MFYTQVRCFARFSQKDGQMAADRKRNPISGSPRYFTVLIAILAGVAIGALLALVAAPLLRELCESEPACQRQMTALVGALALMGAIHIAIVYALVDRLNRQSEERTLRALLHHLDSVKRD